jgi:hypothetical protein
MGVGRVIWMVVFLGWVSSFFMSDYQSLSVTQAPTSFGRILNALLRGADRMACVNVFHVWAGKSFLVTAA